jgi:hypothetical protein
MCSSGTIELSLSHRGNPEIRTLFSLLHGVGLRQVNSGDSILNSKGGQSAAFAVSAKNSIAAHYQLYNK